MNPEETAARIVASFSNLNDSLGNEKLERSSCDDLRASIAGAIEEERLRCAGIVSAARCGERDSDLRSIIYAIKHPQG